MNLIPNAPPMIETLADLVHRLGDIPRSAFAFVPSQARRPKRMSSRPRHGRAFCASWWMASWWEGYGLLRIPSGSDPKHLLGRVSWNRTIWVSCWGPMA